MVSYSIRKKIVVDDLMKEIKDDEAKQEGSTKKNILTIVLLVIDGFNLIANNWNTFKSHRSIVWSVSRSSS